MTSAVEVVEVLQEDFVCSPTERGCAGDRLASGDYLGTFEGWRNLGRGKKLPRVVLEDGRVIPVCQVAPATWKAMPHFRAGACELHAPHGPHYAGSTPGGDYDCPGNSGNRYAPGYVAYGPVLLRVRDGQERRSSMVLEDA